MLHLTFIDDSLTLPYQNYIHTFTFTVQEK